MMWDRLSETETGEEECQRGYGKETVSECLCEVESVKKREYVDDRKICAPLEGTVTIGNGQYVSPTMPTTIHFAHHCWKKQKN